MRLPVVLLVCSALGVVLGAALVGRWAVGCAVMFDSLCAAAWALWGYDDGKSPQVLDAADEAVPAEARAFIERVRPRAS